MTHYQYYPNNQFYMNDLQNMRDKIDTQIKQLQQQNAQQPVPITQNFQIAPQQNSSGLEAKYAESIEDVRNTFVMKKGLFVNKDHTTLWIKDITGDIKTFELKEIVELDDKDREILDLQRQVNELKGEIENAKSSITNANEQIATKKSSRIPNSTKPNAKQR